MAFVLDASVTVCWAFDDEDHPDAAQHSAESERKKPSCRACGGLRSATFWW